MDSLRTDLSIYRNFDFDSRRWASSSSSFPQRGLNVSTGLSRAAR